MGSGDLGYLKEIGPHCGRGCGEGRRGVVGEKESRQTEDAVTRGQCYRFENRSWRGLKWKRRLDWCSVGWKKTRRICESRRGGRLLRIMDGFEDDRRLSCGD